MTDEELSALIRRQASRHTAPDDLRARVRTQAALAAAAGADNAGEPARGTDRLRRMARSWPDRLRSRTLAGFAAGVLTTLALGWLWPRLMTSTDLPADLVASHVRALRTGQLIEVASSDRHTVKPWYQGRLDYAPPVPDLSSQGFELLGGRIDHLAGSATATLTYQRNRHLLSVSVWPAATGSQPPRGAVKAGFSLLHWSDGAMQVWAVSDVEPAELVRFAQAWQARTAPP